MKFTAGIVLILASVLASSASFAATTDDVKWINQCVQDNKDEGATKEVVLKYCTCMNNKMDESESKSITVWEKTHTAERDACSKEAGWK